MVEANGESSIQTLHVAGMPGINDRWRPLSEACLGRNRLYDQCRGTAKQRGYDSTWNGCGSSCLRAITICVRNACAKDLSNAVGKSAPVDHIIPISRTARLAARTLGNPLVLCHYCHARKHRGRA